jgi:hypothetical protein
MHLLGVVDKATASRAILEKVAAAQRAAADRVSAMLTGRNLDASAAQVRRVVRG